MERAAPTFDEVITNGNGNPSGPSAKMSVTTATEVVVAGNGLPGATRTEVTTTSAEVVIAGSGLTGTITNLHGHSAEVMEAGHALTRTISGLVGAPAAASEQITSTMASFSSEMSPSRTPSPQRVRRNGRTDTTLSAPTLDGGRMSDSDDQHHKDRKGRVNRGNSYDGERRRPSGCSGTSWLPIYNRERLIPGFRAWKSDKVFPDADEMKLRIKSSIMEESGSSRDLYKKHGFCQRVIRSWWFEMMALLVIGVNAFWIAIDADMNDAVTLNDVAWYFQLAENLFCSFFVVEWIMRFGALKVKRDAFTDRWFLFDSALALMSVVDIWILTFISSIVGFSQGNSGNALRSTSLLRLMRLFRLMRLSRMVRLMRALPELVFMVRGMLAATRSVFITMVLLFCILYCFGVAFRQLSSGTDMGEEFFGTVLESMYTLLIAGTLLDNVTITVATIGRDSYTCAMLFFVVILLAALTVMNMLIGVTCEVVSNVARTEKERAAVSFVKERVWHTLWESHLDADQDGLISKDEFRRLIETPEAFKALRDVGVDVVAMVDLAELIFQSDQRGKEYEKKLNFHEFMDVVLQLRGNNNATVKDIVDLRRFLHLENTIRNNTLARMEERQKLIEERLDSVDHKLDRVIKLGEEARERRPKSGLEELRSGSQEGRRSTVSRQQSEPLRGRTSDSASTQRTRTHAHSQELSDTARRSRLPVAAGTFPQAALRRLSEDRAVERSTSAASFNPASGAEFQSSDRRASLT